MRTGLLLAGLLFLHLSCVDHGSAEEKRQAINIIFDTDMGSDCDDAGALAVLHAFASEGKAEILGCIYSSGKIPWGAGVIEAINHYYGRPDIPVGAYYGKDIGDPEDKMNAEYLVKQHPDFHNTLISNTDAREATGLVRELLAAQPDQSVIYVTVGHTKVLHDVLRSKPDGISPLYGKELIARKLTGWVAMGALGADNPQNEYSWDWNLYNNGTAPYTDFLLEHFPVPAFFVADGTEVMSGKSLAAKEKEHVVRIIYKEWLDNVFGRTLSDQRSSWDLLAVDFAVNDTGSFLVKKGPGLLDFNPEKGARWLPGEQPARHYLIKQKPGTDDAYGAYLNELIAR